MNEQEVTPTTGVYSGNALAWECLDGEYIDLDYETAYAEERDALIGGVLAGMMPGDPPIDDDEMEALVADDLAAMFDFYESGNGTQLHGDWKLNDEGKYEPDSENPNAEFALIYDSNDGYAQVVWSRTVRYGQPASPCYPGQVDARTDDPTEPEGPVAAAVPVEQIFCTAPHRCCVPYYALPEYAMRGDE